MTKFQSWLLVLWLSFTVLAFSYFISDRLKSFDPDKKLTNITYQQLTPYLTAFVDDGIESNRIIHFSQKDCDCQQTSAAHRQEIDRIGLANDFTITNIELSQHDILPSTPSIAVIGESGEVIYYGPYGQGIACSQTAGYAQTILKNYLKGYVSNIIIKEAEGCYCAL